MRQTPMKYRDCPLSVAEKEPLVKVEKKSDVWFTGYGDNSINFDLLVWMDIRKDVGGLCAQPSVFRLV